MLEEKFFYSYLRATQSLPLINNLKLKLIDLEKLITNENSKRNNNELDFQEFEINKYFNDLVFESSLKFIKINSIDISNQEFGNKNYNLVFNCFESLISKSIHNIFFKCSINDYQNDTKDKEVHNNTETVFVPTKLFKQDQLFEKKCEKFKFIKFESFFSSVDYDEVLLESKLKSKYRYNHSILFKYCYFKLYMRYYTISLLQ